MANSEDKDARDEIRVVADEEEVIRLDAPKRKSVEKSGKSMVETFGLPADESKKSDETEAGGSLKEEAVWGDEFREERASAVVPMGWFYLLGLGLVGVILWMGFQIAFKNEGKGEDVGGGMATVADDVLLDEKERFEAEKHFQKMEEVVAAFLAAETVEERVKFVRHPARVLPLMKDFHTTRPVQTFRYEKVRSYMTSSLSLKPFIALAVETEEEEDLPILIEDLPEGFLVDWESFVCYQPVTPEKYIEDRPIEPVSLRVYATPDNFYAYEFADEEEYQCFRLEFRGSSARLFGYVKRGSEVAQQFGDVYGTSRVGALKPLILKLRFLEGGKADRGVLIENLDSALWAFAEDPAGQAD